MTEDHDAIRMLLGAYVLGGLSAEDRAEVDAHAGSCSLCQAELAGFAGLAPLLRLGHSIGVDSDLSAVEADGLEPLLTRARAQRRARRRRARWQTGTGLAAAALAAAVIIIPAVVSDPSPATQQHGVALLFRPAAAGVATTGQVHLVRRTWGTELDLELAGLPAGQRFEAMVVAADGHTEQAAIWASTPTGACKVSGTSSIATADVRTVRVVIVQGSTLVQTSR